MVRELPVVVTAAWCTTHFHGCKRQMCRTAFLSCRWHRWLPAEATAARATAVGAHTPPIIHAVAYIDADATGGAQAITPHGTRCIRHATAQRTARATCVSVR